MRQISTADETSDLLHPRKVLAEKDFLTVRVGPEAIDELEDQWGTLESECMPHIKALVDGAEQTPERDAAVRAMVVLHLVRSFALRDSYFETADASVEDVAASLMNDRFARGQWWNEHGAPPTLEGFVKSGRETLTEMKASGLLLVPAMARIYNTARPLIAQRQVLLVEPRGSKVEFVLGDTPVVPLEGINAGIHHGASVEGADMLWFPIGPRRGAALVRPGVSGATAWTPAMVQQANFDTWRAAVRFVIARPRVDWRRSVFGLELTRDAPA